MIKNIDLKLPEFNLELTRKFTKGINLIEEANWYWKSVILNLIASMYTKKYPGLRALPKWFVSIQTDEGKANLVKWAWIGANEHNNELYEYIIMWKFWELSSTVKQREVLIKLLGLEPELYLDKELKKLDDHYNLAKENTPKVLWQMLKEAEAKEVIIIEDITRFKSDIIWFKEQSFDDVDKYTTAMADILLAVKDYNKGILISKGKKQELISNLNKIRNKIAWLESDIKYRSIRIKDLGATYESIKTKYITTSKWAECNNCKQPLPQALLNKTLTNIKLEWQDTGEEILWLDWQQVLDEQMLKVDMSDLAKLEKELKAFEEIETLATDDLPTAAKKLKLKLPVLKESRKLEYETYSDKAKQIVFIKEQLKIKEAQLKTIDTIKLQDNIDKLKEISKDFIELLANSVKDLPLDIKLFKTLKNWDLRETFSIEKDWVDYSNLSHWNKMLIQLKLAKIFVDKLWLDFMLFDEVSTLSKDNLSYIKELANDYQLIIAKATWWAKKDLSTK